MKAILSMLAGAFYSASYIVPEPYWPICLAISTALVALMRVL